MNNVWCCIAGPGQGEAYLRTCVWLPSVMKIAWLVIGRLIAHLFMRKWHSEYCGVDCGVACE